MTKGEETRQFIIERSAPVFNKKGLAATAMSDIMKATRLSKGSLYVHFDNKEVLAACVVDYNMEVLAKKVQAALSGHRHPKDQLFAYLDLYDNPALPPMEGGCPMLNFGSEADDTNEAIKQQVARYMEQSQATLAAILKKGIRQGVFKAGWDYKAFATVMFAMIEGGVLISRTSGEHRRMRTIIRSLKQMIEAQLQ